MRRYTQLKPETVRATKGLWFHFRSPFLEAFGSRPLNLADGSHYFAQLRRNLDQRLPPLVSNSSWNA